MLRCLARLRRLTLLSAIAALLTVPIDAPPAHAAPAQFADDGLATTGSTVYAVDPAGRVIHVTVDLSATNVAPGTSRTYTYYDTIGVFTLAEATNIVATTSDGAALTTSLQPIEESTSFAFVRIDLANRLLFGETHTIHLTYDLPDQGPRSGRITRVNPAFAAVLPIPFGDPGQADVRVVVPDAYEVDVLGLSTMTDEDAGDQHALVATAIADPISFDASVVVRDSDALERVDADGEHDVSIAAWPGDTEWQTFVTDLVHDGLPELEDLVGQPWPIDDTLDIIETVAPYLYGYSGWYDDSLGQIEIGDELDDVVVLHELAHVWFNRDLFSERWINEGFAEEMASATLATLERERPQPAAIDTAAPGALRLVDWSTPALSSTISDEQETYAYNALFSVISALSAEIGADRLARVVDAAANDRIAYQGDPDPERWRTATDWRRFLDLLEEVGGSTGAVDLFSQYVVPESELPTLLGRAAARTSVQELEEAGAGWTAPLQVRRLLSQWSFAAAEQAIDDAEAVLAIRDEIVAAAEPLALGAPAGLEAAYESATDLTELRAEAEAFLAATEDLVEVAADIDAATGIVDRVGLLGSSVPDELDDAEAAFVEGDADDIEAAAATTAEALDDAGTRGAERLGGLVALLLIVGVGTGVLRARRHHRADAAAAIGAMPPPDDPWRPPTDQPEGSVARPPDVDT